MPANVTVPLPEALLDTARQLQPFMVHLSMNHEFRREVGTVAHKMGLEQQRICANMEGNVTHPYHIKASNLLTGINRGIMPLLAMYRENDPVRGDDAAALEMAVWEGEAPEGSELVVELGFDAMVEVVNVIARRQQADAQYERSLRYQMRALDAVRGVLSYVGFGER